MGIIDKVKNFINASEEEYVEEVDTDASALYDPPRRTKNDDFDFDMKPSRSIQTKEVGGKIVDIAASSRPHVVFKKLDRFEDVAGVADVLNEKRIVVLNLETCQPDASRRIIDFLYGVAYANSGELKRIAGRAYIITPYNVPLTGELLDELDSSSFSTTF
jgi:cell division inhibitor SepF